jgi:cell division protein FtsA
MKSDLVAVVDLGSTKAACLVAGEGRNQELEVLSAHAVECKGIKRGEIVDIDETARAVDAVIRRAQQEIGEEIDSVAVGLYGADVQCVSAQGFVPIYPRNRSVTREDVLQVINHSRLIQLPADREQIQAIPREFRIDGQGGIQHPVGMCGGRLECTTFIVTCKDRHLANIERVVEMSGRRVNQMVLAPLATGLAVLEQDEMQDGVVVVDIGGNSTDVAAFVGGSVAFAVTLPIGGQHVTSDIAKLLKTSAEEAERLKTVHGVATSKLASDRDAVEVKQLGHSDSRPMQRKVLAEIIQSRMKELATMAYQQIEEAGLLNQIPSGWVLAGGGSLLVGCEALFESVVGHNRIRVAEPVVRESNTMGCSFAVALGMARFALESSNDELVVAGDADWKHKIKTIWSLLKS